MSDSVPVIIALLLSVPVGLWAYRYRQKWLSAEARLKEQAEFHKVEFEKLALPIEQPRKARLPNLELTETEKQELLDQIQRLLAAHPEGVQSALAGLASPNEMCSLAVIVEGPPGLSKEQRGMIQSYFSRNIQKRLAAAQWENSKTHFATNLGVTVPGFADLFAKWIECTHVHTHQSHRVWDILQPFATTVPLQLETSSVQNALKDLFGNLFSYIRDGDQITDDARLVEVRKNSFTMDQGTEALEWLTALGESGMTPRISSASLLFIAVGKSLDAHQSMFIDKILPIASDMRQMSFSARLSQTPISRENVSSFLANHHAQMSVE